MSENKQNFLLSTDIGTDIDDAVALYLAMGSEVLDLKGVYVTNGPVETRAKIAARMLHLAGHDALVAVGEADELFSPAAAQFIGGKYLTYVEEFSVPGNHKRKSLEELGIIKDWLNTMAKQLEELKDVVIASIAPLTNIAKLLDERPDAARKIKTLYVMGGREGFNEHNFSHDSLAARKVLGSDLDIVVVPADVCSRFDIETGELTELKGSKAQAYLARMAALWKLTHTIREISAHIMELREVCNDKSAGLFEGHELFYQGLLTLSITKEFERDPYAYGTFLKMFMGLASLHMDIPEVKQVINKIKEWESKTFKVSDAFVIYALEHPEKVEKKKADISCDDWGRMKTSEGRRHKLVVDVDYRHFAGYLKRRMEQKPKKNPRKPLRTS